MDEVRIFYKPNRPPATQHRLDNQRIEESVQDALGKIDYLIRYSLEGEDGHFD